MKWQDDDLRMGPPSTAGDIIAERNRLREQLATAIEALKIISTKIYQIEGAKKIAGIALNSIGETKCV